MTLYTMGFTQKSAECFFELIKKNQIEIVLDIRLNNRSQLAGFTKGDDLAYFLKEICNCKYAHRVDFAPTKDILDAYKKNQIDWNEYEKLFIPLMKKRDAVKTFEENFCYYDKVCLLCSEPTPEQCHRRLLAEMLAEKIANVEIKHI